MDETDKLDPQPCSLCGQDMNLPPDIAEQMQRLYQENAKLKRELAELKAQQTAEGEK